jgi:hypothetical protein
MRLLYVFIIVVITLSLQTQNAEASSCSQKKENIIRVLLESSGRIRSTMEKVQRNKILSLEDREGFRTKADWLVAWMKDQAEILASKNDCESFTTLISAVRIEWQPVMLNYKRLQAKILLSHLNKAEISLPEKPKEFKDARSHLELVESTESVYDSKISLRKATFLIRTGLRKIR